MPTHTSGKDGTVTVNGTELPITNWRVDPNIRVAETDNSLSGGFLLVATSNGKMATVSFDVDIDTASNPFAPAINLMIGKTLTNLKLHIDGSGGSLFYLFPSFLVTNTPESLARNQTTMANVTVTGRNNGTFSYPGSYTP